MVAARQAVLSVITGGGKWVEIVANADPLYQHLIVTAEPKFWCRAESSLPRSCGSKRVRCRRHKPRRKGQDKTYRAYEVRASTLKILKSPAVRKL